MTTSATVAARSPTCNPPWTPGRARLDFIVQTTVTKGNRAELERLVAWSAEQGAVSFNCYFLVATGRGTSLTDLAPMDYEAVLADLARWEHAYRGRMLVRAKCAPHFMRHVHRNDPDSPVLNYQTRCPCGTQYCRITPDGKLTRARTCRGGGGPARASFAEIWRRRPCSGSCARGAGRKCGACESRALCGGCRGTRFRLHGRRARADPSCAYEPTAGVAVIEARAGHRVRRRLRASAGVGPMRARADERIPSFVRGVVMQRVKSARRQDGGKSHRELLAEVRSAMPIDFSKKSDRSSWPTADDRQPLLLLQAAADSTHATASSP